MNNILIKKNVINVKGTGCINNTRYQCDMCHKILGSRQKYSISATGLGTGTYKKKWDLCDRCMHAMEINVDLWYSRLEEKKKKCYNEK